MNPAVRIDRAALVRRALVDLVATKGFRGTSMAAVAARAGVATGTAYVHYASKDHLVIAAYVEVKARLGAAGLAAADPDETPERQFVSLWRAIHAHLAADPESARFIIQVEASPYANAAHQAAIADDEMMRSPQLAALFSRLAPLPIKVLYDLGIGPAVRLAARTVAALTDEELELVAASCWRAVSTPG